MSQPRGTTATAAVAQRWMEMVLGEKFPRDFAAELRAGHALCALAGKVFKALGMKEQVLALAPPAEAKHPRYSGERLPSGATQRIRAYLSACDLLGVDVDDMFEPDDLLRYKNMDKVYRNILALQAVAVSLSTRRSIDERSSLGAKPTFSPISDQGIAFLHDDGFESPPLIDRVQHMSWEQLLFEYEHQQVQKELENTSAADPSASEGLGRLAHDIWGTEERIRARLMLEDREFGVVPDELHGKLWMLASGAEIEMRRHRGQYEQLVAEEEETTDATRQIDVDLFRTVPQADKDRWSDEKTQQMRRVLVAYSHYNPTLGYCQGLNYIVARMLQFLSEEEAFYLLIKMIALVPEDYYTTMLGLAVDQHVFADLVRLQMPDITAHLTGLGGSGVELSLACTEWFLTLFASPCDREVTIHIWDSIFLLGDELLFRVALALMQLEKTPLLACEHYGDMLKHLNEIGRGKTNGYDLLKLAREQDCVYRARIEDFRAHHRLQLASGIVASAVESEDATVTSSTGRPSVDSNKPENKHKLFGRPKKQGHGIFRHLEKAAGRISRTFDRFITEDYAAKLQMEHPNAAFYYNGVAPMVFDRYWGSKESYNQWGVRNTRVVAGLDDDEPELERRRRLQSESATVISTSSQRASTMNATDSLGQARAIARERRSKSTAFLNSKKHSSGHSNASSTTQSPSLTSTGADEMHQYGRSPRTWIQKFEDWHRELKTQKEKRKAEKRRNKLDSRGDSALASTSAVSRSSQKERSSNGRRTRKSFSSSPSRSFSLDQGEARRESEGSDRVSSPVDRKASSMGPRPKELTELPLSRSFSDPFHSPEGVLGRSPWQHPAKRELQDDIDTQILIRSQDTHSQNFQRQELIAEHAERGRSRREQRQQQPVRRSRNGSSADNAMPRAGSFQYPHAQAASDTSTPLRKTTIGSYSSSRAIPISGRKSEEKPTAAAALHASDMRRRPRQYPKGSSSSSSSSNPYDGELSLSPMFSQLRSSELLNGTDYDALRNGYSQPGFRRNMSLPESQPQHPPLSASTPKRVVGRVMAKRPPPAESARVIRDRAHVVSYMQRKLSDASSLAGSISRSPREQQRMDTSRLSASSSNSSRASDQVFGSNRSGMLSLPYRKGSFSFFDKLSSDLESHLGDLNRSYPSSEVDFGSVQRDDVEEVGSRTLPLPTKTRASALEEFRRRSSFAIRRSSVSGKE